MVVAMSFYVFNIIHVVVKEVTIKLVSMLPKKHLYWKIISMASLIDNAKN